MDWEQMGDVVFQPIVITFLIIVFWFGGSLIIFIRRERKLIHPRPETDREKLLRLIWADLADTKNWRYAYGDVICYMPPTTRKNILTLDLVRNVIVIKDEPTFNAKTLHDLTTHLSFWQCISIISAGMNIAKKLSVKDKEEKITKMFQDYTAERKGVF